MLLTFSDTESGGVPSVRQIGNYSHWAKIIFQVQGPATLRVGSDPTVLATPGPGGALQGLQLIAGDRIVQIDWIGPLYATASGPGTLVEICELVSCECT